MTVNNQPNPLEFSEADTCREFVTPAIQAAGWSDSPFEIAEQRSFAELPPPWNAWRCLP